MKNLFTVYLYSKTKAVQIYYPARSYTKICMNTMTQYYGQVCSDCTSNPEMDNYRKFLKILTDIKTILLGFLDTPPPNASTVGVPRHSIFIGHWGLTFPTGGIMSQRHPNNYNNLQKYYKSELSCRLFHSWWRFSNYILDICSIMYLWSW